MRRQRQTKIVATIGPASASKAAIAELFRVGVDVFRLNFSHGSHADHRAVHARIRECEREFERPIGIMADLQGPKLRIGAFADAGGIDLAPGRKLRLDLVDEPGDSRRVSFPHGDIYEVLAPGLEILLADGRVKLKVVENHGDALECEVVSGRHLSDRKGVNIPGVVLPLSPLTDKDRTDLAQAMRMGVDWIALSFVQRPEDLAEARKLIGGRASLIVKIEKPAAVDNLEELAILADGLMLARGDLGVETPAEEVPSLQKAAVRVVRRLGKPMIVATQMLESMTENPSPTRAEASDVATAVYDGTDAVMLSAETAVGDYPFAAVSMMDRIAQRVERDRLYRKIMDAEHPDPQATPGDAITMAARQVAETLGAQGIVTYTTSGSTTLRAARERPDTPILGLTSEMATARRLTLSYGVHAIHTADVSGFTEMVNKACAMARRDGFAQPGQRLVVTAGVPFGTPGATNVLRIAWIDS